MIYYNGKLMENLKHGAFYNLKGGVAKNVFVPLQEHGNQENRHLYSFYIGIALNSLRLPFMMDYQEEAGLEQFEKDRQVKAKFDGKVLFDKQSPRLL
ncbi:MAG: hypothetical protein JOZ19_12195 [Rubrobacter sp.]|nr:hypothetical protein [Rubrobacter sp.]